MFPECPNCGSAGVIPLSFPADGVELLPRHPPHPVAKCIKCGHRITAEEVAVAGLSRN